MRSFTFLGRGRDRIETDVGKENNGAAGHDSGKSGGSERRPVGRIDQHAAHDQKSENRADLDQHHHVVGPGRFLHAADQQQGQDKNDQKAGHVEVRARPMPRRPHRTRPLVGQVDAEGRQLCLGVSAEANRHGNVADHIFQDQIPADDPGKNFTQSRVGIGVGAAGDRNHRSQFGVAQARKAARDRHQQKRDGDRRSGRRTSVHQRARRASGAQEVDDQVQHLRVQDGRSLEVLSRRRRAGENENSRANDGADAQRGKRPRSQRLLKTMPGLVGLRNQFVDGLAAEKLVV